MNKASLATSLFFFGCQKEQRSWKVLPTEEQSYQIQAKDLELSLDENTILIQSQEEAVAWENVGATSNPPELVGEELRYSELYDGIDLKLYHKGSNRTGYDYILEPGSKVEDIRMQMESSFGEAYVDEDGEFVLPVMDGEIRHSAPYTYQIINNEKIEIESRFVLQDGFLSFEVGDYDESKELVIDPMVYFVSNLTIDVRLDYMPFEAQVSQLCDGQSPNEATIMHVTADGAPSGNWVLRTFNTPAELRALGANGSLQEATGLPPGTTIQIVDGDNMIPGVAATITNLSGGPTFFTTADDDGMATSSEGNNVLGCQNEEACPAGSTFYAS